MSSNREMDHKGEGEGRGNKKGNPIGIVHFKCSRPGHMARDCPCRPWVATRLRKFEEEHKVSQVAPREGHDVEIVDCSLGRHFCRGNTAIALGNHIGGGQMGASCC